jgi:hypothetical protein
MSHIWRSLSTPIAQVIERIQFFSADGTLHQFRQHRGQPTHQLPCAPSGGRGTQPSMLEQCDRSVHLQSRTSRDLQAPRSIGTVAPDGLGQVEHGGSRRALGLIEQPGMPTAALPCQARYQIIQFDSDPVGVQTLVVQSPLPTGVIVSPFFIGHAALIGSTAAPDACACTPDVHGIRQTCTIHVLVRVHARRARNPSDVHDSRARARARQTCTEFVRRARVSDGRRRISPALGAEFPDTL